MSVYRDLGTSPASYRRDDALALMLEGRKVSTPYTGSVPDSPATLFSSTSSSQRKKRYSFTSLERTISEAEEEEDEGVDAEGEERDRRPSSSTFRGNAISPPRKTNSETTPLLSPSPHLKYTSLEEYSIPTRLEEEAETTGQIVRGEVTILAKYTLPIWVTHMLENSLVMATVIAVGHLGKTELAASSIASMSANIAALSIINGFVAALDTLCPQSYSSQSPKTTSLHALRTGCLLVILLIPQTLLFWNARWLLLLLRQDAEVARLAGEYLKVLSAGLPGYALYEVLRRWLQAQGLMTPPTAVVFIVAPLNILLNYILVWDQRIGIGFIGAPLASALSMDLMGGLLLLYCWLYAPRDAWGGISSAMFHNWGPNIKLGLAGTAMVASEWWSWEIVGLASSQLGTTALAAQSCLLVTSGVMYQACFAACAAAAVRVGNLLGANRPRSAQVSSRVALVFGFLIGVVNSFVLYFSRNHLGKLFTSDEEVVSVIASILPLVALFQVFDSSCGVAGGVLRGAGRSPPAAILNIVSYYGLGIPLGLLLTFLPRFQLGLYGLWIGLTVALAVNSVAFTIYTLYIDFDLEADNAAARASRDAHSELLAKVV